LRVELPSNRLGITSADGSQWIWEQLPAQDRDAPFIDQALDFLDAIGGQPGCGCTLAEGLQTLRVNLGALQSASEKREVVL
jgi:predicted dehydrogenase